jgi:hypothetical protein
MTATATEYTENDQNNFQQHNMFIELTEILEENLYSNKEPERLISINPIKIQAFFPDGNTTILQFRRERVKVQEDYETVKSLIATNESRQKTKTKT